MSRRDSDAGKYFYQLFLQHRAQGAIVSPHARRSDEVWDKILETVEKGPLSGSPDDLALYVAEIFEAVSSALDNMDDSSLHELKPEYSQLVGEQLQCAVKEDVKWEVDEIFQHEIHRMFGPF